ncbi:hypothetical protein ABVK25_003613 [Lepraria finkii]|uniref:Uncharacterized protein n=1 Tax=Lepraria finkii TaxID=1340010 RepID=A0ABR4BG16_9LECA
MQSRIIHLCILAIFFTIKTRAQLTYGVDASCNGQIDGVAEEAIYMHGRAATRMPMTNPSDNNQAQVFRWLFKAPMTDQANFTVLTTPDIVSQIGSLTSTKNRVTSNLRVYCDDDNWSSGTVGTPGARWIPVPNTVGLMQENVKPNSERTPGVEQGFYDQINDMCVPLPPDNTDWR